MDTLSCSLLVAHFDLRCFGICGGLLNLCTKRGFSPKTHQSVASFDCPASLWIHITIDFITDLPTFSDCIIIWVIVHQLSKMAHFTFAYSLGHICSVYIQILSCTLKDIKGQAGFLISLSFPVQWANGQCQSNFGNLPLKFCFISAGQLVELTPVG